MVFGCLVRTAYSDAKHNYLIHYLLAVAVVLSIPMLFGVNDLDAKAAAQPLEFMMPFTGIILMTPVFMPEQDENIRDTVRAKKMSYELVCLMRLLMAAAVMLALTGTFVLFMKYCGSDVSFRHFCGAAVSAAAVGSIGFFTAAVSDNTIAGYMAAVIYYVMNFLLKSRLGMFYVFSMSSGSFGEKKWLLLMAVLLSAAGLIGRRYRTNMM